MCLRSTQSQKNVSLDVAVVASREYAIRDWRQMGVHATNDRRVHTRLTVDRRVHKSTQTGARMSEIDVEPVENAGGDDAVENAGDNAVESATDATPEDRPTDIASETALPERVDAPEYVLYGGKGGVGKTTMAAATGLASAAAGAATLVVSTDPAHSLSDTLEVDVPAEPARVREDVPLFAAEIDPEAAMETGLFGDGEDPLGGLGGAGGIDGGAGDGTAGPTGADGGAGPMGGLGDLLGGQDGAGPLMGGAMPGADEAAAMRQLLEYLDDPRFDRVVVDTAPTGHTLRLLELPEMLDSMVGRMIQLRERFSGMMDGVKGMFGAGADEPDSADLDELRDRIERLRATLQDPAQTDFRVVMIPEEMSVVESERLIRQLDAFDIPVDTVIVNKVMEDLADVADVDGDWVVSPDPEHCEFCARRWEVQQGALRRASDLFRNHTVRRVPLLAREVRGEAALRVVAACLD
jgi:arsenite-transporting ATPase